MGHHHINGSRPRCLRTQERSAHTPKRAHCLWAQVLTVSAATSFEVGNVSGGRHDFDFEIRTCKVHLSRLLHGQKPESHSAKSFGSVMGNVIASNPRPIYALPRTRSGLKSVYECGAASSERGLTSILRFKTKCSRLQIVNLRNMARRPTRRACGFVLFV